MSEPFHPQPDVLQKPSLIARATPTVVAVAAALVTLTLSGVPLLDVGIYSLYLAALIAAPGTLIWRFLGGPTRTLAADIAAGTALGFCIELGTYLVQSAFGLQQLAGLWAVAVLAASMFWPRLRSCWRSRHDAQPLALTWILSLAIGLSSALAINAFRTTPIRTSNLGSFPEAAYVDMPFHQALAGGALTQFPPNFSYVIDEPLKYQFFVYEHFAAASTASGIDLTWIVYRLYAVPFTVILIVLIATLAWQFAGSIFAASVASVWTVIGNPLGAIPPDTFPAYATVIFSPTQVYGAALFAPLVLLVTSLSRNPETKRRTGQWVLFGIFALAATGSKGTFLPLLISGLVGALVLRYIATRRIDRTLAVMLPMALAAFAIAYFFVLRGFSISLTINPAESISQQLQLAQGSSATTVAIGATLIALSFGCGAAGWLWIVTDKAARESTSFLFLLSLCGAAVAVVLLTSAGGLSQIYFTKSAWPYMGVLVGWGLAVAITRTHFTPSWAAVTVCIGLSIGLALIYGFLGTNDQTALLPYEVLALLVGLVLLLASLAALCGATRRWRSSENLFAGIALLAFGMSLTGGSIALGTIAKQSVQGESPEFLADQLIPIGGSRLALSLRDQSSATDLVATNAHCQSPEQNPLGVDCNSRHFWITALTERQTLVEGWAYTESAYLSSLAVGVSPRVAPFWNEQMLRDNERVFYKPTKKSVERFVAEYGVRWLFVDRTTRRESSELSQFADLIEENSEAAIYDLQPNR